MRNALFAERFAIVTGVPSDTNAGAITLPAINMKDVVRATLVFIKAAGVAGDDPTITFTQGDGINNGALTNGKALTAITRADTRRHASAIPTVWTAVTQAAASTFTSDTLAEEKGVVAIDVLPEMLDVANDFYAVRASVADTGSAGAQIGVLFWIVEMKIKPPVSVEANASF